MKPSLLALALVVPALGCARIHLGDHDAGPGTDAGHGPPCGPVTCSPGQECCNASCGICTAPGFGCVAIACTSPCVGNSDCAASEYCAASGCGTSGVCVPRAEECTADFAPVCGCDGSTYSNACSASASGVNIAHEGECNAHCEADDAAGDSPDCPAILGYRWNGTDCELFGGCSCVGSACASIGHDEASCERAHSGCASCAPMDAVSGGMCASYAGAAWNGTSCVDVECSCAGADCGHLYESGEACQAAHLHCVPPHGCRTDADCPGGFCFFPMGDCGGGIVAPEGQCMMTSADPPVCSTGGTVCGCDGRTYACDVEAMGGGTSIAHPGACGTCGDHVVDRSGPSPEYCDDGANGNPFDGCNDDCTRSCAPGTPRCDDPNDCNGVESCNPATSLCEVSAGPPDGAACTTADGATGTCHAGACG